MMEQRFVAFLRGINVGGRRVKGPELAAPFSRIGLADPTAFLASGNVVFAAPTVMAKNLQKLTAQIEDCLHQDLGYKVATTLRSGSEIAQLAAAAPFDDAAIEQSTSKPQTIMLQSEPSAKAMAEILAMSSDHDRLVAGPRCLHWLPAGGVADSPLKITALEKLGGPTTIRTQNTLVRLNKKFFA